MKHKSIKLDTGVELINITPFNPLISKCQIKVCYVSDKPNRNKSIITKEVAKQIANSLPGSPIVGYYNEHKEDFEEHNRIIEVSNGQFKIKDTTRPYGFVDLGAKVWFQKFLDDDTTEREYLVTEGWLWTGQYPECQRAIDEGNNQSMELDEDYLNAFWTKDSNGKPQFFIINEAIISKLCMLGEDNEPCFEGSNITAPDLTFSYGDNFKEQLFSMMNEIKELLNEGGKEVFTRYAVEIGDALWSSLYSYLEKTYPDGQYCSVYRIEGIYEENGQKFTILQHRADLKYFRLNFSLDESNGFIPSDTFVEVTKTYTPSEQPQFALADVEAYEAEYALNQKNSSEEEDKNDKDETNNSDNNSEGEKAPEDNETFAKKDDEEEEEKCPKCDKPVKECECEDEEEDKKKKYSLEEIPEYVELQNTYAQLKSDYDALVIEKENLEAQIKPLSEFKANADKKEKEAMIASFYMLSDEDKADVITNIDTYSLDEIEAKLAIICVRNKVSFNLEDDKGVETPPTTYDLNSDDNNDNVPAWVKRAMSVAENMK